MTNNRNHKSHSTKTHVTRLAILLLLLVFAGTVKGQTKETKIDEHIFGIVAGATSSSISNYEGKSRLGFIGGLYWEWRFSENFSTMPSLLYAERGATGIKLAYLTIPIVLKYRVSEKIGIATGVAWDELLTVNADGFERDDFRTDDWRIPITIGYNISNHLSLGISYSFGLTDITKNDNETLRNNWGSIALAYVFNN